ncbi:4'-phosphopantetheinyl transferase superfamily protein [Herbivorax sp. ANBcel31]|uniref:4'-phosphopantetheinyl transferase family protein n=1 Tax=Herbivorax sp. ANBcel31 TaxID=3069754 RepID=UPI0027B53A70|nr:4'-phosphopantetheinyl transferase superfamily protein [Herbivorax sp. ANBcel31]MDQ2087638.1 4'-phosphopantetheinyl transferase superfamily protein [Herbivorax sp. ANBcel31]
MLEVYAVEVKYDMDKKLFEKALTYIPETKQDKIKRFLRYEDSVRSLIAEILIRKIVILKLKIKNDEIFFETGEYGKPYLKGVDDFHFNISHSGKWVVCAISDRPVGVDVEKIKHLDIKIADRFFSKKEIDDLYRLEESERLQYFFDLWTLKESYIKADGRGLYIPLSSISFKKENDKIVFNTQNDLNKCFFKRYRIDNFYKLAVCSLASGFPDNIQMDEGKILLSDFLDWVKSEV